MPIRYEASQTLPEKFARLLKRSGLAERVKGKPGRDQDARRLRVSYSTIPPVFCAASCRFCPRPRRQAFITDHYVRDAPNSAATPAQPGLPHLEGCGHLGKYYYTKPLDYKTFRHVDIAGLIHDADVLINFSHVKGHGSCGFGGACKNIAMGCVTDRTRHEIHGLEGGLVWDADKCTHCGKCITGCNHDANSFSKPGKDGVYEVNYHHCTLCQHCVKICPTGAITLDSHNYTDFQTGMALCTRTVLDTFAPEDIYHINVLTAITALCDCWGMTTPSLVPDIGIMAGPDIVAVERASLDAIKVEDLIPVGIPQGMELSGSGHLFQQLHGKDPFVQLDKLEEAGLGSQDYNLVTVK